MSGYLVDTNVVSEIVRPRPNPRVLGWLEPLPAEALHLSVLTLGELRRGVEKLTAGAKKERLRAWLERDLPSCFEERLLPIDVEVANRWGRLVAETKRPLPAIDSLLAATALTHRLRLVTRNVVDFAFPGLQVFNPWESDR